MAAWQVALPPAGQCLLSARIYLPRGAVGRSRNSQAHRKDCHRRLCSDDSALFRNRTSHSVNSPCSSHVNLSPLAVLNFSMSRHTCTRMEWTHSIDVHGTHRVGNGMDCLHPVETLFLLAARQVSDSHSWFFCLTDQSHWSWSWSSAGPPGTVPPGNRRGFASDRLQLILDLNGHPFLTL